MTNETERLSVADIAIFSENTNWFLNHDFIRPGGPDGEYIEELTKLTYHKGIFFSYDIKVWDGDALVETNENCTGGFETLFDVLPKGKGRKQAQEKKVERVLVELRKSCAKLFEESRGGEIKHLIKFETWKKQDRFLKSIEQGGYIDGVVKVEKETALNDLLFTGPDKCHSIRRRYVMQEASRVHYCLVRATYEKLTGDRGF